jgi:HK97 family phage major capsid protein
MEGDADYQGGATPAEGETKPKMDVYDELVTAEVATIAVLSDVSQQLFDDRPAFISFLRGRMAYRVDRKLDREILNGTGNGTNGKLPGINTIATAYDNSHIGKADSPIQALDVVRFARNQVELANFMPNYLALHPTDWAAIETKKDGDERYLVGDPKTGGSTGIGRVGSIWGLPVITTAGQTSDEFTVGDGTASQLFMRQELTVLASTENGTNFEKNLVTLRAELRAALAHYSTLAHVTGDLSDAVAAT